MAFELDTIRLDQIDIRDVQDESASVSPFIKYSYIIQKITKSVASDGEEKAKTLFFRGQAREDWKVEPSVFRNNQLEMEHELIRAAIRQMPNELANNLTDFERLTKLQHYEMATRLLDVTENPLVALYFACEAEPSSDAVVYISYAYPVYPNALEVQILAHVAHLNLTGFTLRALWGSLQKLGITSSSAEKETRTGELDNYIKLLKRNYFVKANLDNARIKQQSGAFLLSGCIGVVAVENRWDSLLEKSADSLVNEFTHKIVIPAGLKAELLEELDHHNINEASVYPELDHQLRYIRKKINRIYISDPQDAEASLDGLIGEFITTDDATVLPSQETSDDDQLIPDDLQDIVKSYISNLDIASDVCKIFIDHAKIDWPHRKQLQADISRSITRYLFQHKYQNTIEQCSEIAKSIIKDAVQRITMPTNTPITI